ncbi:MAG: phenylalanine--tRNA ligase subunit beta [Spirochaeta sp.]|jgi:phenylalanyl-tRNA synthetase beta chain|nr:phenylalanine--tRNA ligase subunit beta [Spirochaeta sp.]
MPKIEVYRDALIGAIGAGKLSDDQLESVFPAAKAELDEPADAEGVMKVELNDTNRPDLWSTAGLGRQLRLYHGGEAPHYRFFSDATVRREHGERRVVVDRSVQKIRPWVVGFVISGAPISEAVLKDLIQTQEKLTWNYGRKRRSIAMGVYRADLISFPVHFKAVDPDATRFVPLQDTREMSMREIITEHPKGQEYGHIVADLPLFPLLTDDNGDVLSFPPVINSASIGAVQEGDTSLFIELTGTDIDSLLHTASIVACDVSDMGYTVEPVQIEYPYDTPYGREITVPYYFQQPQRASLREVNALLGETLATDEVIAALKRMGIAATEASAASGDDTEILIRVPEYRNDFLHAVDIVEDVMIGRGMDSFAPEMPRDFTVGRLTPVEEFSRRVKTTMVGLGFQEMIFNYLGSGADYVESMYDAADRDDAYARTVRIANPMSENYEFVRPSILPSLLGAEAVSGNAAYPHHIFEVGNIALRDDTDVTGTATRTVLGFLSADGDAGFNLVNSHISAILFYLGREYTLREVRDSRFIPGRAAEIVAPAGKKRSAPAVFGVFGEVHPRVLETWGIQVPCTAGEINLERLLEHRAGGSSKR